MSEGVHYSVVLAPPPNLIPIFLLVLCFHTVLPLPTAAALALGVAVSSAHLVALALQSEELGLGEKVKTQSTKYVLRAIFENEKQKSVVSDR
jgi:hypothetical protein